MGAHKIVLIECEEIQKRIIESTKHHQSRKRNNPDHIFTIEKFGLTAVDIRDITEKTDLQIFLAVICFIYTGYLKVEGEKVGFMNNLCHLLKCSSLSEYLKDKEKYQIRKPRNLESYAIFVEDGVAKKLEEYEKEMELLESLQLKAQLVVEKDKDKND